MGTGNCTQCEVEQVSSSRPWWYMGQRLAIWDCPETQLEKCGKCYLGQLWTECTDTRLWWGGSCGYAVGGMVTPPISNTWRRERFRVTCWLQVCAPEWGDGGREDSGLLLSYGTSPVGLGVGQTWGHYYQQPLLHPNLAEIPTASLGEREQ